MKLAKRSSHIAGVRKRGGREKRELGRGQGGTGARWCGGGVELGASKPTRKQGENEELDYYDLLSSSFLSSHLLSSLLLSLPSSLPLTSTKINIWASEASRAEFAVILGICPVRWTKGRCEGTKEQQKLQVVPELSAELIPGAIS